MPDLELGLASRAILTQQHFRALLPASPIVATVDLRELMFLEEGAGEEAIGGEMPVFAAGYDFHRHRRAAGRVPFGLHLRPQFLDALFFVARHDLAGMPVLDAARRLYADAGFRPVASEPFEGFGQALTSERWECQL